MSSSEWIREGTAQRHVAIFLKVVAVLSLLGALSHLASILSLYGASWAAKPPQLRIADLVLLPVDLALAWGLWRTKAWAVIGWLAAMLFLQFVPILVFGEFFAASARQRAMLNNLLVTNAVMLGLFALLFLRRKRG